jgi:ribulose kinase
LNRSSDSSSDSTISAQYSLIGTLIAAALAAGVGVYSAISNNKLQWKLTKLNAEQNERNNRFQIELKNIEAKLASQKSEHEARLEYEYDALKTL